MAMYCPRVLMMPLGPAPYLKMVVVPGRVLVRRLVGRGSGGRYTEDEADDHADSLMKQLARALRRKESRRYLHPPIIAPIVTVCHTG